MLIAIIQRRSVLEQNIQKIIDVKENVIIKENDILHTRGKCDENDLQNFYIKKENNQVYIENKRFINND